MEKTQVNVHSQEYMETMARLMYSSPGSLNNAVEDGKMRYVVDAALIIIGIALGGGLLFLLAAL